MKSLPSYDEALKRVTTSDTNHNKISKVITHNNQTKNFAPAVTSKSIETNGNLLLIKVKFNFNLKIKLFFSI
jgi:hypothetical protein